MLRKTQNSRTLKDNLMLASSTAFVAGAVNVTGLIAFFAFSSNVTGHVASLANNIALVDTEDVISFSLWLASFFLGAYVSSYIIKSYDNFSNYKAYSIPLIIEIIILTMIAVYCDFFYEKKHIEGEVIVGFMLFSMGLQNGMASIISGGLIKSTHLTGLITDLGAEIADYFHPKSDRPTLLKNKLFIRITILSFYIMGGVIFGYCFYLFRFEILYVIPVILMTILYYDVSSVYLNKLIGTLKNKR